MKKNAFRPTALASVVATTFAATAPVQATEWACAPGSATFWSAATNWNPGIPLVTDPVFFTSLAACRQNVVDANITIASLSYRGAALDWDTVIQSGRTLSLVGPLSIGVGDPASSGGVRLGGGGSLAVGQAGAPRSVSVGFNNSVAGTGTTVGTLTLQDASLGGFIDSLSVGRKSTASFVTSGADGSFVLGTNSTLSVGTALARADVFVGYNNTNAGSATGLFDARQGSVDIHATDFTVGGAYGGSATGTLRWDRPTVLDVTHFYLGRGIGTGVLDLAPGATFALGSASARGSSLNIAYNDSATGSGTAQAQLDLSVSNPVFSAYLADNLSVGRKSTASFVTSGADGSFVLGTNSTLSVGTTLARADVFVGYNNTNAGSATGLFDARQGSVDIHATDFTVGGAYGGSATGTLRWDRPTVLDVTHFYLGRGIGTGVLDLAPGATFALGSASARGSSLNIAYNDSATGSGTAQAQLDLSVSNPVFSAYLADNLSVGRKSTASFVTSGADGSFVLGTNSTLSVGTALARADVFVGYNNTNAGSATGLFDARQGSVDIHATDFTVGGAYGGSATGTLRWDRPTVLDVTHFYLGRGIGTGVLDLAPGATFALGSASARGSSLNIAYNDSATGSGTAQAQLDLSVSNPVFSAYLADNLSVGRKSTASFVTSGADGSFVLGTNSTLSVGTALARADVFVGYNNTNAGSATGLFDARQGSAQIFAATTYVGLGTGGSGTGTFSTGARTALDTTTLLIGAGSPSSGTFNLRDGIVTAHTTSLGANGRFVFTGGRFNAINFNGALVQDGGVLAPGAGADTAKLTITQGYTLASPGTLEIELHGVVAGTGYDQLIVAGMVDLARGGGLGGTLDLRLDFDAPLASGYLIIDNDGTEAVLGTFAGLGEGGSIVEQFGDQLYTFRISYLGGTGNDVVLNLTGIAPVPEPRTAMLLVLGLAGMTAWRWARHSSA